MKKHLLRLSGLATLVLLLQNTGFAQSESGKEDKDTAVNNLRGYDEIVIKRKSDKDAKVTVEIKNGQVFIDGKLAADYQGDDLSVRKRKIRVMDGRTFSYNGSAWDDRVSPRAPAPPGGPENPDGLEFYGAPSPFRNGGGWSYDGKKMKTPAPNQAMLGVTSQKQEDGPEGAKIMGISDSSAAAKAGLKVGDLITKVDEIRIDGPEALAEAIHKYKPQDKVTVTFKREGKEQKVTATLGRFHKTAQTFEYSMPDMDMDGLLKMMPPMENFKNFGGGFKGQGRLGLRAQDTEDGKGVKVLSVDEESAADKAGIKEGDIITRFDNKEVNSTSALVESAQGSKGKPSVHVNVLRNGKPLDVDIKTPRKLRTADL